MAKKQASSVAGVPSCCSGSVCKIESVVAVDDRGQLILPKDVREKAGIKAGEKLVLVSWSKAGRISCFALMKAEALDGTIQGFMAPIMGMPAE